MGLMYIFPNKENEFDDRISISQTNGIKTITLKNYGLPMIFWGYLSAALIVLLFMFLAVKDFLFKMVSGEDSINKAIAVLVILLFTLGPLVMIGFFFYEKVIRKSGNTLSITQKVFWIPFNLKKYEMATNDSFEVSHYLSSPNLAKMKNDPKMRSFENQGYFELWCKIKSGENILLDRHTRRADLNKISELLSRF